MYALPKKQKLPELNVTAITMRADRPIHRNHQVVPDTDHQVVPDTDHQALPGCATRRCGLRAGVAEGLGQGRPGRLPGSGWVIGDRRAARKTTRTRRAMTTDERAGLESDPIVPYADPADLPAPLRSAIESYRQRMGFLPNALELYMYRPQILKCLIEINNTIMRDASGHLDEGLERRIAAVCSALDHRPHLRRPRRQHPEVEREGGRARAGAGPTRRSGRCSTPGSSPTIRGNRPASPSRGRRGGILRTRRRPSSRA